MCSLFQMEVEIKEGVNLIARDRSGNLICYFRRTYFDKSRAGGYSMKSTRRKRSESSGLIRSKRE